MPTEEYNQSKIIKPCSMELAWQSSDLLRWQDKRELEGLGHPPFFALPMSVAVTENPICFYTPKNELAGFAGVVDEGDGIGRVWMLTTEAVETMPLLVFCTCVCVCVCFCVCVCICVGWWRHGGVWLVRLPPLPPGAYSCPSNPAPKPPRSPNHMDPHQNINAPKRQRIIHTKV